MKKQIVLLAAVIFLVTVLAGCGGKTKYEPQAINEATDKCATCNMQVKDDAFATQLTTTDGKTYKFDDLGCMNEWKKQNVTAAIGAQFVRDYNTKEWIKYEEASYVYDPSFKSPMAYGIYSFKDKAEAQKFIDTQKKGKLMGAADLATHNWQRSKGGMNMGAGHNEAAHSETSGTMNGNMNGNMNGGNQGMHAK